MPNFSYSQLRVTGKPEDIEVFMDTYGLVDGKFQFQNIVPMPEDLDVTEGTSEMLTWVVKYGDWYMIKTHTVALDVVFESKQEIVDFMKQKGIWMEEEADKYQRNLEKYGFRSWYDWRIEHWGTKWDVVNQDHKLVEPGRLEIGFATAWDPPIPVIKKLCKIHPELTFRLQYFTPHSVKAGILFGKEGKLKYLFFDDWMLCLPEHMMHAVLSPDSTVDDFEEAEQWFVDFMSKIDFDSLNVEELKGAQLL